MTGPVFLAVIVVLLASNAIDPPPQVAFTPDAIDWQPAPQAGDGRERALLAGRPEAGGTWTYRLRVANPIRVEPHTHLVDESITVLEGRWSLGIGRTFQDDQLKVYPAGSFVIIPAGTPHYIRVDTPGTIIQASGSGVFSTHPVD